MKAKVLMVIAVLGSLAGAGAASAQVRYSPPAYRGATRAVNYNRASTTMWAGSYGYGGYEAGCAAGCETGCGGCDSCQTGCGRCSRPCLLGGVARGIGCLADRLGSTLDCLFPSGGCCQTSCCEQPCCSRRPACGDRCCERRVYRGCDRGCAGGCSDCTAGHLKTSPFEDDREAVPNPAKPEAPSTAPTPEPEAPKDARQYRPLPPARTSAAKPRATSLPKQPAPSTRRPTVPASAEEEIAPPAKAPRTLTVRPTEAKRLTPAWEDVDEEEPVKLRASVVQPASSRVPANPLRSR